MKNIVLVTLAVILVSSLIYSKITDGTLVALGKEIVRKGTLGDQELAVQIYKQIDKEAQAKTLEQVINDKWPNTITATNKDNRYPKLDAEQIKRETKDVIRKYNATLITPSGISCSGI